MIEQKMEPWIHGSKKHLFQQYGRGNDDAEFGRWIESLADWTWFVTRTFGPVFTAGFNQIGNATARRCLVDLVVWSAAQRFACVFERQEGGNIHLHALLAGTKSINGHIAQERDIIRYGISRWKQYKPLGGAAGYLGKYLTKQEGVELYIGLEGPYEEGEFYEKRLRRNGGHTKVLSSTLGGLRV
jgi:hypothetical protein